MGIAGMVLRSNLIRGFLIGFLTVLVCWRAFGAESKLLDLSDAMLSGQARIDLIKNAKTSITAQYFIYADDETSFVSLSLLRDAARRGVKVRILVDAMFNGIPKELREYLQVEGVEIREYHPFSLLRLSWLVKHMHDKVLIADQKYMITGGRNIQNDYYHMPGRHDYNDRDIYVEDGTAVSDAVQYFNELWGSKEVRDAPFGLYTQQFMTGDCRQMKRLSRDQQQCAQKQKRAIKHYQAELEKLNEAYKYLDNGSGFSATQIHNWSALAKPVKDVKFIHDPVGKKSEELGTGQAIVELFDSAKSDILIESPYTVPHANALEALERARARGVRVRLITNSNYNADDNFAILGYYKEDKAKLQKLGVELFEYKGPQTLHAKTYIVDGNRAFVGSYNLDRLSHKYNTETGVLFEDVEIVQGLIKEIEESMNSESFIIGSDGMPTNLGEDEGYPWPKGKRRATTTILEILLPLYRDFL
jgi:putative cardiolipin synthase